MVHCVLSAGAYFKKNFGGTINKIFHLENALNLTQVFCTAILKNSSFC